MANSPHATFHHGEPPRASSDPEMLSLWLVAVSPSHARTPHHLSKSHLLHSTNTLERLEAALFTFLQVLGPAHPAFQPIADLLPTLSSSGGGDGGGDGVGASPPLSGRAAGLSPAALIGALSGQLAGHLAGQLAGQLAGLVPVANVATNILNNFMNPSDEGLRASYGDPAYGDPADQGSVSRHSSVSGEFGDDRIEPIDNVATENSASFETLVGEVQLDPTSPLDNDNTNQIED